MVHSKKIISLDTFTPRPYQLQLCKAFESGKYKRFILNAHRRMGKDICAFNLMVRAAVRKVGVYYYVFPTYSQAKKVIWDSITSDGKKFLDFIPKELMLSSNSQEMKIKLTNGSLIQLIGSDNVDAIVGTNPVGIVFSEYALQDPRAYQFLRPILLINDGWSFFISTPRGKNHFYDMYKIAEQNPDKWYSDTLTIEDTKVLSKEDMMQEVEEGLVSLDLAFQEYMCSFTMGVEGSYYAKYIDRMRINNQIGTVPWESGFKVHTAWDIGVRDSTAIIFFQTIGGTVRIIDCYEKNKEGLEHYIKFLDSKPYIYGKHIAPHDMAVKEFGSGMTRIEKARQLGIKFTLAPNISIMDGIESVRSGLSKTYIDQSKCGPLIKALENYRQEFDSKKKVYKMHPLHNEHSHMADASRYMFLALPKTRDNMTPKDIDNLRAEAMMGGKPNLPGIFN